MSKTIEEIKKCKDRLKELKNMYSEFSFEDLTINPNMSYEEYCSAYGDKQELLVSRAKYQRFIKSIKENETINLYIHEEEFYKNKIRQFEWLERRRNANNIITAIKNKVISSVDLSACNFGEFREEVIDTLLLYGFTRISNSEWQKVA